MRYMKTADKIWVAQNLSILKKTRKLPVSNHLARQLEDAGYLTAVFKKGPTGHMQKRYVPNEKAERLLDAIQNFN